MPEENKQDPSLNQPSPQKKSDWRTVLTVIFLVLPFFLPIGLILVWFLAPWRRKIKLIITLVIVGLLIICAIVFMLSWPRIKDFFLEGIDTRLIFDMNQIGNAAAKIYSEEGNYAEVSCLHAEISGFCSEITTMLKETPAIHNNAEDAYCAYTKLFSGKYFCLDSQQPAHEVEVYPGGTGYCDGETFVCP